MNIQDLLVKQGNFLFRWRSLVPLVLIFPAIAALSQSDAIQNRYGDHFEDAVVFGSYVVSLCGCFYAARPLVLWLPEHQAGIQGAARRYAEHNRCLFGR